MYSFLKKSSVEATYQRARPEVNAPRRLLVVVEGKKRQNGSSYKKKADDVAYFFFVLGVAVCLVVLCREALPLRAMASTTAVQTARPQEEWTQLDNQLLRSADPLARISDYFRRLIAAFGWRYCAILFLVYGVCEGMGEAFVGQSQRYYFFDIIKTTPARFTQIEGFTNIPWQIKALYGMVSDNFAICGAKRTPYMIIAGIFGVLSATGLWILPPSPHLAAMLIVCVNFSIASPDVMVDASTAERAKIYPNLTADVQSLCWASLHFVSFISYAIVGKLLEPTVLGSRGVFGLIALTSLANLLPASFGWLGDTKRHRKSEEPDTQQQQHHHHMPVANPLACNDADMEQQVDDVVFADIPLRQTSDPPPPSTAKLPIFTAAICTCAASVTIGAIQQFYLGSDAVLVAGVTSVCIGSLLAVSLYLLLRIVSKDLAGAAVFIFAIGAFQPTTDVIFDWSHDDGNKDGNCSSHCGDDADDDCGWAHERNLPCVDPAYYGLMRAVAQLFGFFGVVLYNAYLSNWTYRSVYSITIVAYFFSNMLDLFWVSRMNLVFGIPDYLCLCGLDIVQPVIKKLHVMPLFVLAARLCPSEVEGTLFALLMGLSNFGSVMGLYNGAALLSMFGGVEAPEFRHLPAFVVVRTLFYLVPLLFVPVLIPKGSPNDEHAPIMTRVPTSQDYDPPPPPRLVAPSSSEIELIEARGGDGEAGPHATAKGRIIVPQEEDEKDGADYAAGKSAKDGLVEGVYVAD